MKRSSSFLALRCSWCGAYGMPTDFNSQGMCLECAENHDPNPSGECIACGCYVLTLYDGYCGDCWEAIEREDW